MATDLPLLIKSPSDASLKQPPLARDPLIRTGSKVTFDLTDPRCHPGGKITPGVAAVGTIFTSLDGVPVQARVLAGGTITVNTDGSLLFSGFSNGGSGLYVGADKQFDMSAAEYERLMYIWMKYPASGYNAANYSQIMGIYHTNNNNSQGNIDSGVGGIRPRFGVGNAAGTASVNYGYVSADAPLNQVLQLAGRFDPASRVDMYRNGVQMSGGDTTQSDVFAPSASENMIYRVPNLVSMTVYRFGMVDIDASVAAETTYGFLPDDIMTAAQHAAEDYKFGTGVLPGAERAAFA